MANRYCNLVSGNDIKDDFPKISTGFDNLEKEMDQIAITNANVEVGLAHVSNSKSQIFPQIKDRFEELEEDVLAVESQILALSDGSPKGSYETLAALEAAFPTGGEGVYLVVADGKWYYWNTTAWTAGGVYQAVVVPDDSISEDKLLDGAVTPNKTIFFGNSTNLFDKSTVSIDMYVASDTGLLVASTSYNTSDYITISASTQYITSYNRQMAFYDENKTYISGISSDPAVTRLVFATPSTAKYMRISVTKALMDSMQINLGTYLRPYNTYKVLKDEYISTGSISGSKMANASITPEKFGTGVLKLKTGKNLFNKATATSGYYVSNTSGTLLVNASYAASYWIAILPNTVYTRSYTHQLAYYTSEKVFISGVDGTAGENITTPANAYFMRITTAISAINTFQVELGSSKTTFESFRYYIDSENTNTPVMVLPAAGTITSTYLATESVTSAKIENRAITPDKFSTIGLSKNIFNKATVTDGYYVSYSTGVLSANVDYVVSDWILVTGGLSYAVSNNRFLAFYDSNKVFISGLQGNGTSTEATNVVVEAPETAAYMRISIKKLWTTWINETFQVEQGTSVTGFVPFSYILQSTDDFKIIPSMDGVTIDTENIEDSAVTESKTVFFEQTKNIFDKTTVTVGKFVAYNNGNLYVNVAYNASDWIPVLPSTEYTTSYNRQLAFYTAAKVFISGIEGDGEGVIAASNVTFTTPSDCNYMRISIRVGDMNTHQVELGGSATPYEPYGSYLKEQYLKVSQIAVTKEFLLFLPNEICIAVGRTIELYNKQVCWCGNINNYHFKWTCAVGKAMKRKWTFTAAVENIGEYQLTCTVYDNNMTYVASETTTVKIVSDTVSSGKTILPIGDSLTNGKAWLAEVRTLSGSQYSFVGTRWNGDVQGGYLNHEGRSGASSNWYLTDSTYTYELNGLTTNNPFWNPATSRFDWAYYKTTYNINPDVIQIYLGTNGITLDPSLNAGRIKQIVDYIRLDDPNIQIFVVFTLFRGDQDGIGNQLSTDGYSAGSGVWKLEEDRKVYNLMVELNALLSSYPDLYFIPISLTHDSEYNFKDIVEKPVNPRSTLTELYDKEATHPSGLTAGYLQMADIIFSTIVSK